ncbi:HD domain-containing protein [Candidatus Woesearchaeota archaeon]|nr:HD domain-containing protein [Candidatus Woesearchaeota archaeon]
MNQIDKNPNYKEIYDIVKKMYFKKGIFSYGTWDETYYSMRVYETCKLIFNELKGKKINKQEVLTAAILHDIGKVKLRMWKIVNSKGVINQKGVVKEWKKHPKMSVPIATKILSKMGHSEEFIKKVCYLIENHDQRKELMKKRTIELKILQDADLIADIGMSGFIRPFSFGAAFKRPTIGTIKFMSKHPNRIEDFEELNLEVSKKLAKKEIKYEKELISMIAKNIETDLFDEF